MIAHVFLDEAVAVVAADDRIGQMQVLDFGLQLAAIELADLAAEDGGDLVRLADGAIGVEEPLAQLVEGCAATEDQIVAELGLREEQSMPAAGFFPLRCGEERREAGKPLLAATDKIVWGQLIGEFLQAFGVGATHEGVRRLPEVDALLDPIAHH
jgi:hypothetical protein